MSKNQRPQTIIYMKSTTTQYNRGNDVNDFSPLSKFIQFHNLESIKLTIKKKANLVFLNDLNNLTKLADFALD